MIHIQTFEKKYYYKDKYRELMDMPYNEFVPFLKKWVDSSDFSKMVKSGKVDKSKYDEKIKVSESFLEIKDLKPTHKEIDVERIFTSVPDEVNIKDIIECESDYIKSNKLFVANNKYIIDGHYRWAFLYALNPNCKVPCINIDIPGFERVDDILKVVQLSIAATYDDIYIGDDKVKNNLFDQNNIKKSITPFIPKDVIHQVSKSYSKLEMMKNFSSLLLLMFGNESLNENFSGVDDEETITISDGIDLAADLAGIIDPTGAVDITNGIRYLNKGEYLYAISSFISAVPYVGDIIGKPIIFASKSGKISKTLLKAFSKALKKFDFMKLSVLAKKLGKPFEKLIKKFKTWLPKLLKEMSKWVSKLGDKFPKLRRFYKILKNSRKMWKKCKDWLKKLKGLRYLSNDDAIEVISTNLSNLVKDNKKWVNKINIESSLSPDPLKTAILVGDDPNKNSEFSGVPIKLLNKMQSGEVNFKPSKNKLKSYESFKEIQ